MGGVLKVASRVGRSFSSFFLVMGGVTRSRKLKRSKFHLIMGAKRGTKRSMFRFRTRVVNKGRVK